MGVSWAVLGGLGAVLGGHGSPKVVLSSTRWGEGTSKIALELRLPMFQSFLKVRLGRVKGGRGGVVTRPPVE